MPQIEPPAVEQLEYPGRTIILAVLSLEQIMSRRVYVASIVVLLTGILSLLSGCQGQPKQTNTPVTQTRPLDEIVEIAIAEVMGYRDADVDSTDAAPAQEVELIEVITVKIPVRIVVGLPEGSSVPTASSTEDLSAFKSAIRNGDRAELRGMLESNRVVMLPKFTRAMELERVGDLARIQVVEGPMNGRQLWISTLWLR